jgi:hypothetical protein
MILYFTSSFFCLIVSFLSASKSKFAPFCNLDVSEVLFSSPEGVAEDSIVSLVLLNYKIKNKN